MKTGNLFSRVMSALLVLAMVLAMVPVIAGADEVYTNTLTLDGTDGLGTATLSTTTASEGDTVTLTVSPTAGLNVNYQVSSYPAVEFEKTGNEYTFTQPANNVKVTVTFSPDTENLHLDKTAVLQADGTWTITLEAFATGEVKTIVTRQVIPTDIILVLDQSGSMQHDNYKISAPNDTYTRVTGNVTNQQVMDGDYYYYDANDRKYYPVEVERVISKHDTYWQYTMDGKTESVLQSAADGVIGTSLAHGSHTVSFETGMGYLLSHYILYQRTRSNNRYTYSAVAAGTDFKTDNAINAELLPGGTLTPVSGVRNGQTAHNNLVNVVTTFDEDMQTDDTTDNYALAYIPATLVNADEYYYVFTYVDDQGQTWTLGHSDTDTGAGMNIADANYDKTIGTLYTRGTTETYRLPVLKTAAHHFVENMRAAAVAHNVDHRIAMVGFGSDNNALNTRADGNASYNYDNTELLIGSTQYNFYTTDENSDTSNGSVKAAEKYAEALQSVGTETGFNNLNASIDALGAKGATFPAAGFEMAQQIIALNETAYENDERNCIILFMTDGEPGESGYNDAVAKLARDAKDTLLTAHPDVEIKTLAILDEKPASNMDTFLKYMSTSGSYTLATSAMDVESFFEHVDVETGTSTETVELSENAYLVDRVSEYFNMPENTMLQQQADESNEAYRERVAEYLTKYVKIYFADHLGNLEFDEPVEHDYHKDTSAFDPETCSDHVHAWPNWSDSDNLVHGIATHNYDFTALDNMVRTEYKLTVDNDGDGEYDEDQDDEYDMVAYGKKLIIEISGITAKTDAALGYYVPTNNSHSGLWDNNSAQDGSFGLLEAFPMPVAEVYNKTYVLDYAQKALLDTDSEIRTSLGIQKSVDGAIPGFNTVSGTVNYNADMAFAHGHASIAEVEESDGAETLKKGKLYYTPTTMEWNGYDTMYIFWDSTHTDADHHPGVGDPVTGYGWSRVNVIPANNVYYEDSFIESTHTDNNGTTGDASDDFTYQINSGIVYSNGSKPTDMSDEDYEAFKAAWEAVGSGNGNVEHPEHLEGTNKGIHGWTDNLADDAGFSDGMAHMVQAVTGQNQSQLPKATFTFTGTGMDLYSFTNNESGSIMVQVKDVGTYPESHAVTTTKTEYFHPDGTAAQDLVSDVYKKVTTTVTTTTYSKVPTKFFLVDNLAVSNGEAGYYQIPTVSFAPTQQATQTVRTIVEVTDPTGNRVESSCSDSTSEPVKLDAVPAHSTYEATIFVTHASGNQGRFTYYLDGIRVYNPLTVEQENDPVVDEAYGDEELKSVFTEVRDIVLLNEDFNVMPTVPEYAVTFDLNYTLADGISKPETFKQNTIDQKLTDISTPVREGYIFTGWYDAAEGGEKITLDTQFASSQTVYAQWTAVAENAGQYVVTFDYNYTGAPESALTATTVNGSLVYLPEAERSGYTLSGWFTEAENGTQITTATTFAENTTVYAQWTAVVTDEGDNQVNNAPTEQVQKEGAVFIDWIKDEQSPDEDEEGIHTYTIGVRDVFEKYGPKNEIYLERGQSIVIKLDTANSYQVGLKSLKGDTLSVEVSAGDVKQTLTIAHTSDMYYKVTPSSEGYLSIKNVSTNGALLAITKLKTTNPEKQVLDGGVQEIMAEKAVMFAATFARMAPAQTKPEEPETPETPEVPETPETPEIPETPEVPETPETPVEPETPDVEIENPDPEPEPDDEQNSNPEPEGPSAEQQLIAQLIAMINRLFNSMRSWLSN